MIDYETLQNKPSINGTELSGDLELSDVGIEEMTPAMVTEAVLETFGVIL